MTGGGAKPYRILMLSHHGRSTAGGAALADSSLALALSFRTIDRTLTDEDIEPVRAKIVAALQDLGGELRG